MVFNTLSVGGAVTPSVIQTFFSHYLNRSTRSKKPTAHISYDEGINLIRSFLIYASHHTVEDIQRFTSQWVPHPTWVKTDEVIIEEAFIKRAAMTIQVQLGVEGIKKVGGNTWWQWRRPGSELKAEMIEMKSDFHERSRTGKPGNRVMLYVHGGAYFFGSVDEHRYQMQRHARKLGARVFARMLVILRDQGLDLPAGAVLISPWVDLTHSFPSVSAENPLDYIPPYGFHHRPSPAWPPPNADDMHIIRKTMLSIGSHSPILTPGRDLTREEKEAAQGFSVDQTPPVGMENANANSVRGSSSRPRANTIPGSNNNLSIMIDGSLVEIKDQIQMYAANNLISHPLVSPILQPSLGGLCPLLILTGGGEMLRDEQIYVAHKAANPEKYPPGDAYLNNDTRSQITRHPPTNVQLQVWDDLCHVAPTLSFTRPAKYMYRSVAQFGAWALARAQQTTIDILDDDDISTISSSSSSDTSSESPKPPKSPKTKAEKRIGKAGDSIPRFINHMIRQRVDRHGVLRDLEPEEELPSCTMSAKDVGVVKQGPVKKWMAAKRKWDTKYASAKRNVQGIRIQEMAKGYQSFGDGEIPPPSALAGRIKAGVVEHEKKNKSRSFGMMFWARMGSSHDRETKRKEARADTGQFPQGPTVSGYVYRESSPEQNDPEQNDLEQTVPEQTVEGNDGSHTPSPKKNDKGKEVVRPDPPPKSRSRSRRKTVTDQRQTEEPNPNESYLGDRLEDDRRRPKLDGIAFPFSLKDKEGDASESMITLTSDAGVEPGKEIRSENNVL